MRASDLAPQSHRETRDHRTREERRRQLSESDTGAVSNSSTNRDNCTLELGVNCSIEHPECVYVAGKQAEAESCVSIVNCNLEPGEDCSRAETRRLSESTDDVLSNSSTGTGGRRPSLRCPRQA